MIATMAAEDVGQAAAVDRDALLSDLFRAHYLSLVRLACLLLDERGAGEEVVQDAFVRLHGTAHRIRDADAAPAYLRSIDLNLARSRMRRRLIALRRQPRPSPDAAPVEEVAILHEDQREVLSALRSLPPRQRECLALRYFAELSEADIAATLGISTGSVKTHTSRGLAALTSKLEKLA
jgi:RNA polymerase sigma-70 factor (sigma-E family)